jgi:hypothetical protein
MWIVIHFARHAFIRENSANKAKGTALVIGSCAVAKMIGDLAIGLLAVALGVLLGAALDWLFGVEGRE